MRWLAFVVVLCTGGCGAAPEPAAAPTPPTAAAATVTAPDPQASVEPRSEPGDGQKLLQRMAGTWDCVKTFHGRSGNPSVVQGECVQTMIHAGRFLKSEFTFRDPQATSGQPPSTGLGLIGFDAQTKVFTSFWTDSRSTRVSIRQSQAPLAGDEIVLFSKTLGDEQRARASRTVTRIEDDGRRIVHRQYALAAEGPERLQMELIMTRKG